jgi:transcription antitermination factor NusB
MRRRTKAREFALQILYQIDITGISLQAALQDFWQRRKTMNISQQVRSFAVEIVSGVADNLEKIDKQICCCATNWQLKRMAVVDRNILRLGAFELLFRQDIPPKVSINEAVDLAKKYSGQDSGKFVNGILDKIKEQKGRE